MKLDKSKPYGENFGALTDGVKYIQGGMEFSFDGTCLTEEPKETGAHYEDMHHKTLKKLVEERGGEWSSKEDAIKWLEANDVS